MINVMVDNKQILGFGIYQDDFDGSYRVINFHDNIIMDEKSESFIDAFKYIITCEDDVPYVPVRIDFFNTEDWLSESIYEEIAKLDLLTQFSSNGIIIGMIAPINEPEAGVNRMLTINFSGDINVNTQMEIISDISNRRDKIKVALMTTQENQ